MAEKQNKLLNFSLVCAILVVMIHVPFPTEPSWAMRIVFPIEALKSVAVPCFFLVSGFLLGRHFDDDGWYSAAIKKRFKTLFVPYVTWLLFAFLTWMPLHIVADILAHRSVLTSLPLSNGRWLQFCGFDVNDMPGVFTLWYIRNLLLLVVLSPLIRYGLKMPILWMLICGVLLWGKSYFGLGLCYPAFQVFFNLEALFYFSLGALIGWRRVKVLACAIRFEKSVGFFFLLVGVTMLSISDTWVESFYRFSVMIGLWMCMPNTQWPPALTRSSFAIYVMHGWLLPYLGCVRRLVVVGPWWYFAFLFLSCVTIPVVSRVFLSKTRQKLLGVCFLGGRV